MVASFDSSGMLFITLRSRSRWEVSFCLSTLDIAKTYSGPHKARVYAYFRQGSSAVVRRLNVKQ